MNEKNEIGGDFQDEYRDIQELEDCNENAPVVDLDEEDLDAWYRDWVKRNPDVLPANCDARDNA
jgi:hypothetical protein